MRTLRDVILFLLLVAGFIGGQVLTAGFALKSPITWLIAIIGATLSEGIIDWIYHGKIHRAKRL